MTRQELEAEIKAVENEEILVATNDGTFGATECCRITGSGDPQFGRYEIFERVGGGDPKVIGRDPDNAPGRKRELRAKLSARRRRLSDLRQAVRRL